MADKPFTRPEFRRTAKDEYSCDSTVAQLTRTQMADFIHQYRDELSRFIVRKLGSEQLSSDILQDAYLRLAQHQSLAVIDNPRAFVFRIVANLVIDYQGLSVNWLPHDVDEETVQAIPENQSGPETRYQHQQRLEAINKATEELPKNCRLAFYLNRLEGYSHAEVAERLQLSERRVAKHLARAMKHCRDRLKQY
jgi:RNA polymerase sigma factor (sigma-70 family)